MKNSGLIFSNTAVNIDNEVNIIETNSNKKYKKKKKKKHAARSCRHNKVILADRNIYHNPCLHIQQEHDSKLQQKPSNPRVKITNLQTYDKIIGII